MVLYFSGTGNSRYIAKKAAEYLADDLVDIGLYARKQTGAMLHSDKPWVLVVPAYCSYVPLVVERFLLDSTLEGNRALYLLMTCGGTFSRVGVNHRFDKIVRQKGLTYRGIARLWMPENYITMFAAPPEKVCKAIIENTTKRAQKVFADIANDKNLFTLRLPSFFTYTVNRNFYRSKVTDKPYWASDRCIGCGKCQALCPLDNIEMKDGKPLWKGNCTQCMACIGACPKAAIEYGNKTKHKRRYYLP